MSRSVILLAPPGGCAVLHDFRSVAGTGRHDYQECRRCGARRILDLQPQLQPSETVDVGWVLTQAQPQPEPLRCTAIPA